MNGERYSIAHPTEFSDTSRDAFHHALRIALAKRGELNLLHIDRGRARSGHDHFPAVRETLSRWGYLAASAPREAVETELGLHVSKVGIHDENEAEGVEHYARRNGVDLIVVGTSARAGLGRMLRGSVSEDIAAHTDIPTLFVQAGTRGFVDGATGTLQLSRILVPVAATPDPTQALYGLQILLHGLGIREEAIEFVHMGDHAPPVYFGEPRRRREVRLETGDPIETIIALSEEYDLVAMPTERRNSLMDELRGTTTERVVRHAACPVLAIPA